MKIDTLGVQGLVALADHGAFGRAARALHITQAALSRRIKNLEEFLGVTLVERTTRSVALTAIGLDFVPQARRLLADLESALVDIRETGRALRGDVTLACVPTVGVQFLPAIVKRYAARHPHNRIRILDHSSSEVAAIVLRREAEFGINMQADTHPDLETVPLMEDRFVLVCRDDHPLAARRRLAWRQIQGYALILGGHEGGHRPYLDAVLQAHDLRLRGAYEVQRSSTAVGMVAKGVAAAIVPGLAVQEQGDPRLRAIALTDPVVSRRLVLVMRRKAALSPAAQALYDMIRER